MDSLRRKNNKKKNKKNEKENRDEFQVAVFFAAAIGDMVCWFYKRDRLYIILALVHSCFMMGTL